MEMGSLLHAAARQKKYLSYPDQKEEREERALLINDRGNGGRLSHHPLQQEEQQSAWKRCLKSKDGWPWVVVLGVASVILAFPAPESVPTTGWGLLAIFIATIVGAVVRPGGFGLGPLCIMAVAVACGSGCLSIQAALKDLGTKNLWLVVMAFFIARALIKSNLASRLANKIASLAGEGNTLALAYCFICAEVILAPMIPSVTARTGSIIFPLIVGTVQDRDRDGSRNIASFLTLCAFQASSISSAMFVTAMAGNPIVQGFANDHFARAAATMGSAAGSGNEINTLNWMLGALVPGLICLLLVPLIVYSLHPPLYQDAWLADNAKRRACEGRPLDGAAINQIIQDAGWKRTQSLLFRDTLKRVIQTYGDVEGRARTKADEILGENWMSDGRGGGGGGGSFIAHDEAGAASKEEDEEHVSSGGEAKEAEGTGNYAGHHHSNDLSERSKRRGRQRRQQRPWSSEEMVTLCVVLLMLFGWIAEGKLPGFKMDPTTTAFAGVSVMILARVLTWKDIVSEANAWNTLVWLAILSGLANGLREAGVIGYFSNQVSAFFKSAGIDSGTSFSVLTVIYIYSHYLFASCTAHMISMYTAFLGVAVELGIKPLGAALLLGYASNLMGGLTHYASGAAPVLFGRGYVSLLEWWRIGFIISLVNTLTFLCVGTTWMRFLSYI